MNIKKALIILICMGIFSFFGTGVFSTALEIGCTYWQAGIMGMLFGAWATGIITFFVLGIAYLANLVESVEVNKDAH